MASDHRGMGLEGKNVVVLGVADESSLAWAIAKRFAEHGAHVFIGYQQKFFSRVRLLLLANPAVTGRSLRRGEGRRDRQFLRAIPGQSTGCAGACDRLRTQ